MQIEIRFAVFADLDRMKIILETAPCDWPGTVLHDCFTDDYFQWVVTLDKVVAGFVIVRNNIDAWEIMQIAIDKQYQQQGFGGRLLRYVIWMAEKMRRDRIDLEVRASNTEAIQLYQACGFQKVGERKKYYSDGEDALLLSWIGNNSPCR
ncbi:MAG: hypothetical protein ACD_70C00080G0001 [uncultured bacterium]|nr:MAG: hypothetical protein ACD_70C00080G0001 [uncultured bacterium]OGT27178.1 MAG: ribosomal-protein-alanine N-acetyltransferase [Gammaproteobacteria bacterium RIFCSPHIGHO2_02_FULL_42_43]OGT28597.1 MAG: ribosomal-protein-alanine N-acetyltransferase [Gammaproteobacteria bacterium RIFCSPHIGHO2_01_FULL_42_8]OGT50794.1 MAG: ribosomal-protein-alanine N-acetyltransferase [Gammaproteobacteria bacterium RIFCSPHIGHO2_12_FULL_41_25]OGT61778.1 MAG: ribosomal-protein-alanine N-acetyltransferase [Gammapro